MDVLGSLGSLGEGIGPLPRDLVEGAQCVLESLSKAAKTLQENTHGVGNPNLVRSRVGGRGADDVLEPLRRHLKTDGQVA